MGEDGDAVWIKSQVDESGIYHVYLEIGPDDVVPLDVDAGYRWAREVLSAVAAAEYDAAVVRQLTAAELQREVVAEMVSQLRADRAEYVPVSAIPGLALIPGVSAFTGQGFLRLERNRVALGQWELPDARQHALMVIEAFEVSILDSSYLHTLNKIVGVARDQALFMVADLANHRGNDVDRRGNGECEDHSLG